jgi:hypothetical protein
MSETQTEDVKVVPEVKMGSKPDEGAQEEVGTGWVGLATNAVVSACVAVVASLGVWFATTGGHPPTQFGVVDLATIVDVAELRAQSRALDPSATAQDKAAVMDEIKAFGPKLEAALLAARKRCGCVLLAKNSYVGPADVDVTEWVKADLGLSGLTLQGLKNELMQRLQAEQGKGAAGPSTQPRAEPNQ